MNAASTVLTAYNVTPNVSPSRRTQATWYTSPAAPDRKSSGATTRHRRLDAAACAPRTRFASARARASGRPRAAGGRASVLDDVACALTGASADGGRVQGAQALHQVSDLLTRQRLEQLRHLRDHLGHLARDLADPRLRPSPVETTVIRSTLASDCEARAPLRHAAVMSLSRTAAWLYSWYAAAFWCIASASA